MAFIKVGNSVRINIDSIIDYSAGTYAGEPMTAFTLTGMSREEMPLFAPETPDEIDALIAAANAKEIRDFHAVTDALCAEDEEKRDCGKCRDEE